MSSLLQSCNEICVGAPRELSATKALPYQKVRELWIGMLCPLSAWGPGVTALPVDKRSSWAWYLHVVDSLATLMSLYPMRTVKWLSVQALQQGLSGALPTYMYLFVQVGRDWGRGKSTTPFFSLLVAEYLSVRQLICNVRLCLYYICPSHINYVGKNGEGRTSVLYVMSSWNDVEACFSIGVHCSLPIIILSSNV